MPLRARRRRLRAAIIFGILAAVALFVWAVSYVSYLPQFSVNTISVSGTEKIAPKLVEEYVETVLHDGSYQLLSRSNIFLYPRGGIESGIVESFPRINTAQVSRNPLFSTELHVAVTERKQFALWCSDSGQCYEMDEGGFIFAASSPEIATSTEYVFRGDLPAQAGIVSSTASNSSGQADPIGKRFIAGHMPNIVALLTSLAQAGFMPEGASVTTDGTFSSRFGRALR